MKSRLTLRLLRCLMMSGHRRPNKNVGVTHVKTGGRQRLPSEYSTGAPLTGRVLPLLSHSVTGGPSALSRPWTT